MFDNVERRQINVVYFNAVINNVRQLRNNVVIFNVEFHNVDQRRNNILNITICKKFQGAKNIFELQYKKKNEIEYTELQV